MTTARLALFTASALALLSFAWWPPAFMLGVISAQVSKAAWAYTLLWFALAAWIGTVVPAVGALLAWSTVTLILRSYPPWGQWTHLTLTLGLGLGVWLLVHLPHGQWRSVKALLVVSGLVTAAHLILQVWGGWEWPFPGIPGRTGASGLWGNPWMAGVFVSMVLPLLFTYRGVLIWLAGAWAVYAIWLTGSRVAWASLAAGWTVMCLVRCPQRSRRLGIMIVALVLIGALGAVGKPWQTTRDIARLHIWRTMGDYLLADPGRILIGFGTGSFGPWFSQLRHDPEHRATWSAYGFNPVDRSKDGEPQEVWYHAHNEYAQAFFEWGLIGMALLAWVAVTVRGWCATALARWPIRAELAGVLGGLTAFMVGALGAFPAHVEGLSLTAVLLAVGLWQLAHWDQWPIEGGSP